VMSHKPRVVIQSGANNLNNRNCEEL
jgi:hypothetical protein